MNIDSETFWQTVAIVGALAFGILFTYALFHNEVVYEGTAEDAYWQTVIVQQEYKWVHTHTIIVGKVPIAQYGWRWRNVREFNKSGTDSEPTYVEDLPLLSGEKHRYVYEDTRYYVVVNGEFYQINYETWLSHEPSSEYKISQNAFGSSIEQRRK